MRELELTVGEVHRLDLRGHGSAGYSWQTEVAGAEGVVEIRRVPSGPGPSAPSGGRPPDSGSLPVVLELVALAEGRVRVLLTLRRPFEEGVEPLEDDELDVTVTAVAAPAG